MRIIALAALFVATSATVFKQGDNPTCYRSAEGKTIVHYDAKFHPSFKCGWNAAKTACACSSVHPTHHHGKCIEFQHTNGMKFNIKGDCTETGHNPIHGGWSDYTAWAPCTKSCGTGSQVRTRTCTNPSPKYNGNACSGSATETQACGTDACPIHGGWSGWTSYSTCSKTCGGGTKTRTRQCNKPTAQFGGIPCSGKSTDIASCNMEVCIPQFHTKWGNTVNDPNNAWSGYSTCSGGYTTIGMGNTDLTGGTAGQMNDLWAEPGKGFRAWCGNDRCNINAMCGKVTDSVTGNNILSMSASSMLNGGHGWGPFSNCPDTSRSFGLSRFDLHGSGTSHSVEINHITCDINQNGCRVYGFNSDTTVASMCAKVPGWYIDVVAGSRKTSSSSGWTAHSTCPSGYKVVGFKEMDNFSHAPNDVNHFSLDIGSGARAYYYGGTGSSEALCAKILRCTGLPQYAEIVYKNAAYTTSSGCKYRCTGGRTGKNCDQCPSGKHDADNNGSCVACSTHISCGAGKYASGSCSKTSAPTCKSCTNKPANADYINNNSNSGCSWSCKSGWSGSSCTTFTPQMEIKWGNTVNDPNNNWSGYSTCPSGYTVIGMGNVDLTGGTAGQMNDLWAEPGKGFRAWCGNDRCNVNVLCGRAADENGNNILQVTASSHLNGGHGWGPWSSCPSGYNVVGLSRFDLHGSGTSHHIEVNHMQCSLSHNGCRVYGFNSDTTVSSMCAKSSNSAYKIDLVGGSHVSSSSSGWTAYSPCPAGYKPVGFGEMDNFSHAPNDVNHFEVHTSAGARAYYNGGTGNAQSLCAKISRS